MPSSIRPIIFVTAMVSAGCGFLGPTVRPPKEVRVCEPDSTNAGAGTSERRRYELQIPYHVSGRNPHDNFRKFASDQNYWMYLDAREGRVTPPSLVLTKVRGGMLMNEAVAGYVELGATVVTIRLDVREHYWDPTSRVLPWAFNGTFGLRSDERCSGVAIHSGVL